MRIHARRIDRSARRNHAPRAAAAVADPRCAGALASSWVRVPLSSAHAKRSKARSSPLNSSLRSAAPCPLQARAQAEGRCAGSTHGLRACGSAGTPVQHCVRAAAAAHVGGIGHAPAHDGQAGPHSDMPRHCRMLHVLLHVVRCVLPTLRGACSGRRAPPSSSGFRGQRCDARACSCTAAETCRDIRWLRYSCTRSGHLAYLKAQLGTVSAQRGQRATSSETRSILATVKSTQLLFCAK